MTEHELRHWREREIRRRLEEEAEGRTEPLASPDAFSDDYTPENPEIKGRRGRQSSTVEGLLGGGCCGWSRRPNAAELYDAMRADRPTERQMAVAAALIGEAGIDDLLMAHLEGAFTWRQLAAMIHRLGIETTELSTYLNNWTADTETSGTPRTTNTARAGVRS